MTLTVSERLNSYAGNGVTTDFSVTFPFFEIDVYVDDTLQTSGTDYTISQANSGETGTVIFNTAPSNGSTVSIVGNTNLDQNLDLLNIDAFPAESVEASLDRIHAVLQENQDKFNRALGAPPTSTDTFDPVSLGNAGEILVSTGMSIATFQPGEAGYLFWDGSALDVPNSVQVLPGTVTVEGLVNTEAGAPISFVSA